MTNEQRRNILSFLLAHSDGYKLVKQNQLRFDDDYWYIREDKLPVSRKDGSCSTINQRLIDPLIFDWLMERLPDFSELADVTTTKLKGALKEGSKEEKIDWSPSDGIWVEVVGDVV